MRFLPLGVIIAWQVITLGLSFAFGLWAVNIPYEAGLNSKLQVAAFSICAVFGSAWFFLSVAAFPRCVSDLSYAHGFTRDKGVIMLGWLGVLSAILAVAAMGLGIFVFTR